MAETWNKKEREKKKQQQKKAKAEKKQERKDNNTGENTGLESMMAYLDENGNLSSTPPDPTKKFRIKAEDIEIGVPKQGEINPEDLIRTGIITFFNHDKGYGFIKDMQTQESIFVHINALNEPVKENNKVSFEVEMGPKGANAVRVKLVK